MLIRGAEIGGRCPLDARIAGERIAALAPALEPAPDELVLDARGGALLPGLHDHHIHLLALAAARGSLDCGPAALRSAEALARALAGAARTGSPRIGGWIRGVGYHEQVAGPLDRARLDVLCPDVPLRIQHRSGALWMLNGAGLAKIGLDGPLGPEVPAGVERDARGRANGRMLRVDAWLRERWGSATPPGLAAVGRELSRFGVTGVSDATPGNGPAELAHFAAAIARGDLPQRLRVMGGAALSQAAATVTDAGLEVGERKLLLAEHALPSLDELRDWIAEAHVAGRAVAIHCVTRAELALAAGALAAAGSWPGDRIEHASVAPPDLVTLLAGLGVCVVTQPNFVRERGDTYLSEVEAPDRPWLYRCRGLIEAGVALGGGTDAPFGRPDPWCAMRAAVERRSASGRELAPDEALSPERALALFLTRSAAPGGPARRLEVGQTADLCLLDRPWAQARRLLTSEAVRATVARGRLVHDREADGVPGEACRDTRRETPSEESDPWQHS